MLVEVNPKYLFTQLPKLLEKRNFKPVLLQSSVSLAKHPAVINMTSHLINPVKRG